MKKLLIAILAVFIVLSLAGNVLARKAEINLSITATTTASTTEALYVSSVSQDLQAFGLEKDATSGTQDFLLFDKGGSMPDACWSIQPIMATTTGGDSTFDISYKAINADHSAAAWAAAPLTRIIKGASGNASAYSATVFNPPPAKYLRFYVDSGVTAYSTFTARVVVTEAANCPEPALVRLSVESLTVNTSGVSNFAEPDDAKEAWVNLIGGPFRFGDSSSNPSSTVGQIYYGGDSLFFYGKDDIDKARFLLDSTAASGSVYVIYYGRP